MMRYLTVPKAIGDFFVLDAIYKTDGCAVAVDDHEILEAEQMLASREGTFVCPEGAANLSAPASLREVTKSADYFRTSVKDAHFRYSEH